jgi:hypothetical protein
VRVIVATIIIKSFILKDRSSANYSIQQTSSFTVLLRALHFSLITMAFRDSHSGNS